MDDHQSQDILGSIGKEEYNDSERSGHLLQRTESVPNRTEYKDLDGLTKFQDSGVQAIGGTLDSRKLSKDD